MRDGELIGGIGLVAKAAWGATARTVTSIVRALTGVFPYLFVFRSGEMRREVTEQYPDPISSRGPEDLPLRFRGKLQNDINKCTGCRDCQTVCPVDCIYVEVEPGPAPIHTWVSVFDIDNARCVQCGLCVEVCEPTSLTHSREFELATRKVEHALAKFGRGRITPEQRAKWARIRQAEEALRL